MKKNYTQTLSETENVIEIANGNVEAGLEKECVDGQEVEADLFEKSANNVPEVEIEIVVERIKLVFAEGSPGLVPQTQGTVNANGRESSGNVIFVVVEEEMKEELEGMIVEGKTGNVRTEIETAVKEIEIEEMTEIEKGILEKSETVPRTKNWKKSKKSCPMRNLLVKRKSIRKRNRNVLSKKCKSEGNELNVGELNGR